VSTRGGGDLVSLADAIGRGLAPDGGLYVPERVPVVSGDPPATLADLGAWLLAPYFEGEALAAELSAMTRAAFSFDAPLRWLEPGRTALLELFHGPTAAFKDFGARFLAECMYRLDGGHTRTILVATSGDTGAAVAAAFHRRPHFRVVILYPDGRVSARQAHQLGAFGDNVRTFKVAGTFDDCQRMAKEAFQDAALTARHGLASANSICLGRLLPQVAYHAHAAARAADAGCAPANVIVPTGNLGNALACLLARAMGLPIGRVVLATNANRVLSEWFATGRYEPRPSVTTLANAMDVGAPSNLERLVHLFPGVRAPASGVSVDGVDDDAIRAAIRRTWDEAGVPVCPHTACGLEVLRRIRDAGDRSPWIVCATAHPAKFESIVEPLLGKPVPPPPALAELLSRPSSAEPLAPSLHALRAALG
jgi:threonine synthase